MGTDTEIKVLVVEDCDVDYMLLCRIMARSRAQNHFVLERAACLADGIRLVADNPDAVLLDLTLPDSKGLETFSALSAAAPDVPIILFTGLEDEELGMRAVHAGAEDYLVKGNVNVNLLSRAIRYAIERKRIGRELKRYAQALREHNVHLADDLRMARVVQRALLPTRFPTFPPADRPDGSSTLTFDYLYRPCSTVGGDFFSVFSVSPSQAGIFVCDVMGQGMRAALVTAIIRGLLEELRGSASDPGELLSALNRGLITILGQGEELIFASAVYMVVDCRTGQTLVADAGHPRPLHLQAESGRVVECALDKEACGPVLGVFADHVYASSRARVREGDKVVFYTDGLSEIDDGHNGEFGDALLVESVEKGMDLPLDALFAHILEDADKFSPGGAVKDDVCLVGMHVYGVG